MENFRIESLEINKIGAFEHLKMDFPKKKDPEKAEIHILTGENGTGKSTVLLLLTGIADNSNQEDYLDRVWREDMHFTKSSYRINYRYSNEGKELERITMHAFDKHPSGLQENLNSRIPVECAFFSYSSHRNTLPNNNSFNINQNANINPFKDSVKFNKSVESENFLNWVFSVKIKAILEKDKGNFIEYDAYLVSLREIENALTEITQKPIEFVLKTKPYLYTALKVDGIELDINVLPDGIKSTVTWLGDLLMRLESITWIDQTKISLHQNFILFLDEIEIHLHPAWQRKILPVVQKLFKNAQIFISTHSPFVVGSVDGAWVHKFKKDGAYAVLDGEPVLSEDAESYDTILEEIFGVKERFGIRVEEDLKKFYQFKSKILGEEDFDIEPFLDLVSKLASESIELESMLGMELKQIKRLTGKDFLATA